MIVSGGIFELDNTTVALGIDASYQSSNLNIETYKALCGSVYADQAGTLYIEQSFDGTNWDISSSVAISAGVGESFEISINAPYGRVRYVNGATAQTVFRLYTAGKTL